MLTIDPHPLLILRAFTTEFPAPIASLASPFVPFLTLENPPVGLIPSTDALRAAVRDLLRHGGFKPTGRSKPASEYLIKAAEGGFLGSINAAVDACNVASLHSGFPISVVDLARVQLPLRVGIAEPGSEYVFNSSGQTIDIDGLLCLFDATGPCANAVKDSQRTKTDAQSTRTFSVLWGVRGFEAGLDAATTWYQEALVGLGAEVRPFAP